MKSFSSFGPLFLLFTFEFLLLTSCSVSNKISKSARNTVLNAAPLKTAHIGISIYDPETGKYLYNYQGDKYFVPASNTKIPTCYAAMKYLGDSLVGLRYAYTKVEQGRNKGDTVLGIIPTADPTFLHGDFTVQPVLNFLQSRVVGHNYTVGIIDTIWQSNHWGSGWSWSDYDADYLAERSPMPIYGNLIDVSINPLGKRQLSEVNLPDGGNTRFFFKTQNSYFDSLVNHHLFDYISKSNFNSKDPKVEVKRDFYSNQFSFQESDKAFKPRSVPFITNGLNGTLDFIRSSFQIYPIPLVNSYNNPGKNNFLAKYGSMHFSEISITDWNIIHSQPTDSLLKPMMHRSDNFFAEQSLLMVSNEHLGIMSDSKIIDTLLKTDFKDLPQKPRWADGSGLSRYNLFTPQDFVTILNKMKNEFGMERIKTIFPTGGEGTISSYYKAGSGYIYAKTGTLSGVVALSGFLYTKKGKLLILSTLVNNHQASSTEVRRAVERFVESVREKY